MQSENVPNESLTDITSDTQAQLDEFFSLIESAAIAEGQEAEKLNVELEKILANNELPAKEAA